jgi:hypothetical protein
VLVAMALGESVATMAEEHPVVTAGIDTVLTLASFLVTWYLVRKAARRASMGRRA